jgi:hypothetical protein
MPNDKRDSGIESSIESNDDDELVTASQGFGPLLQRDYWAVISRCSDNPQRVIERVSRQFAEFAPAELCEFSRADGRTGAPLSVGDVLNIRIRMAGDARVRVVHQDSCSFTLGTLRGHPEAGKITFGAYRNGRGDLIFHIRSRARSSSAPKYAGFLALGDPMQTDTWTEFVNRVALTCGEGAIECVHADTVELPGDAADLGPTFSARAA